jgi:hydrogenase large subunit
MALKTIFPMTRVHEPLRIDVQVENGKVVDAWVGGLLFRGMESMLTGRDPRDVSLFTQRICGICSSAHAMAATMAQQQAFGIKATPNGQLISNLIVIADMVQNHLRHFYLLALYDYVQGPDMPPWTPRLSGDYRLPKKTNDDILGHARQGLEMAIRAHEMLAIFGAKAPHSQTILPTGVTQPATAERLMAFGGILQEIKKWVETVHMLDVMTIADYYSDYYTIGTGYGNLLSFGMLSTPTTSEPVFAAGIITGKGSPEVLDAVHITESVQYSWYDDEKGNRHPAEGITVPDRDKPEAYTWVKAPRYKGLPYEGGPLARAWMNGDYRKGVSVMDRLVARQLEVVKLCRLAADWLELIIPNGPTFQPYTPLPHCHGVGLMDTMRGPLGHWMTIRDNKVSHYQIVTPTSWNFAPRDSQGLRGPVEQALLDTPVADADSLIEVGRVVRSFDPCFTCAIHAIRTI